MLDPFSLGCDLAVFLDVEGRELLARMTNGGSVSALDEPIAAPWPSVVAISMYVRRGTLVIVAERKWRGEGKEKGKDDR